MWLGLKNGENFTKRSLDYFCYDGILAGFLHTICRWGSHLSNYLLATFEFLISYSNVLHTICRCLDVPLDVLIKMQPCQNVPGGEKRTKVSLPSKQQLRLTCMHLQLLCKDIYFLTELYANCAITNLIWFVREKTTVNQTKQFAKTSKITFQYMQIIEPEHRKALHNSFINRVNQIRQWPAESS